MLDPVPRNTLPKPPSHLLTLYCTGRRGASLSILRYPSSLPLCSEVWGHIADFLGCNLVSQICWLLHHLLGRRYLRLTWHPRYAADTLDLAENLRLLSLRVTGATFAPKAIDVLRRAKELRCLTLHVESNADMAVEALAALKGHPSLQAICLTLVGMKLGEDAADALRALKDVPTLRTLVLDIACLQVGPTGAQALAALNESPELHTLMLNLR